MRSPVLRLLIALVAAIFIPSCAQMGNSLAQYQAYDLPAIKPTNANQVKVKVSLQKQRVYVMEGSKMLLAMPVSVGTASTPTPSGNFRIFNKNATKRANTHGYATDGKMVKKLMLAQKPSGWTFKGTPMPYWCEFKPNYGFHTGWVKHHPCTHGCIRMHENLSPKFYQLVKVGTPVHISYTQPEDSMSIPLPPDSGPLPDYPTSMYLGNGYFKQHKTPQYQ